MRFDRSLHLMRPADSEFSHTVPASPLPLRLRQSAAMDAPAAMVETTALHVWMLSAFSSRSSRISVLVFFFADSCVLNGFLTSYVP